MTPDEALRWLDDISGLGWKLTLDRVEQALVRLGSPQRAFSAVHVAGTNGKGSCCAVVEATLLAAGLPTGRMTSPHVCRLEERVRIGGRDADPVALARWLTLVREAASDDLPITYFEAMTAAGYVGFAERGVPWGVLIATRGDRTRKERALTRLDVVSAKGGVYAVKTTQADVFGRRSRITLGGTYRGQGRIKESALHYGGIEAALWVPIHWLLRAGLSAQWAITPAPAPEGKTLCCSTFEVSPRIRAEVSRGTFRPMAEAGFILFWPAGNLEGEPVTIRNVTAGFDVGGGLIVTPERTRRIGISATGLFGALAGIGPHVRIRVAAEVRF